jgi:hypothetical protein
MALINIGGYAAFPSYHNGPNSGVSTALVMDAADEKAAMINRADKAGTITTIELGFGAITTGATVDVRVETVDATTGMPTGNLVNAGANASLVVGSADDNTKKTVTLGTAATVTLDQRIAIVVAQPTVSFGNMNLLQTNMSTPASMFPYSALYAAAAWSKQTRNLSIIATYGDGSKQNFGGLTGINITVLSFNNTSTPDEIGIRLSLPFPCKCGGAWLSSGNTFTGDTDFVLYDASDVAIATGTFDADIRNNVSNALLHSYFTPLTLAANTVYRLTMKPTSATNLALLEQTFAANGDMSTLDGGIEIYRTERTDGGAFTNTNTKRPVMGLYLTAFDDGTGSGGRAEFRGSNL